MWCAPPLLLLPPCFLFSHLPSPFYLPQLLSFSPCVYVQGRGWLIGLTWWLCMLVVVVVVVVVEEGECGGVV